MKVGTEILDPRSELSFQDLLVDVAAAVAATETDRTANCHESSQWDASRKSPRGRQTRLRGGII
jgi:hypothetical protein